MLTFISNETSSLFELCMSVLNTLSGSIIIVPGPDPFAVAFTLTLSFASGETLRLITRAAREVEFESSAVGAGAGVGAETTSWGALLGWRVLRRGLSIVAWCTLCSS